MAQPVRMIFTTLPKSSLTFRSLPLLSAGINPSSAQFAGFFWGEEVVSSVLFFSEQTPAFSDCIFASPGLRCMCALIGEEELVLSFSHACLC